MFHSAESKEFIRRAQTQLMRADGEQVKLADYALLSGVVPVLRVSGQDRASLLVLRIGFPSDALWRKARQFDFSKERIDLSGFTGIYLGLGSYHKLHGVALTYLDESGQSTSRVEVAVKGNISQSVSLQNERGRYRIGATNQFPSDLLALYPIIGETSTPEIGILLSPDCQIEGQMEFPPDRFEFIIRDGLIKRVW